MPDENLIVCSYKGNTTMITLYTIKLLLLLFTTLIYLYTIWLYYTILYDYIYRLYYMIYDIHIWYMYYVNYIYIY